MKDRSKRLVVCKRGIIIVLLICFFHTCFSLPPALGGGYHNCTLDNGRAIPQIDSVHYDVYSFVCNAGFELVGEPVGLCTSGLNLKQFCQYKKCVQNDQHCLDYRHCKMESHDSCLCNKDTDYMSVKWKCTHIGWTAHYCERNTPTGWGSEGLYDLRSFSEKTRSKVLPFAGDYCKGSNFSIIFNTLSGGPTQVCAALQPKKNMHIYYSSPLNDNMYPYDTWATYTCIYEPQTILAQRRCTSKGWTNNEPSSNCGACGALHDPKMNALIAYSSLANDNFYPYGTVAMYTCFYPPHTIVARRKCTSNGWSDKETSGECVRVVCVALPRTMNADIEYSSPRHYSYYPYDTWAAYHCPQGVLTRRRCTSEGLWSGNEPSRNCEDYIWTTRLPVTPAPTTSGTHHRDAEKTLVIVSGTTGAILGTLIVLVIIVSCQRRLRYHRMRRARLRCREDQNAFAAYITYNRDIRLLLPSYDEAINQQHQGQPPTFDEAVANNGSPNAPSAEPSPPPDFSDDTILVSLDSQTVGTSGDDDQAPPSYSSDGRFFRAVRMLFGGRAFTPRAIYCHLVPYVSEENDNRAGPQDQPSRENNASSELNNEGNEGSAGNDNEGVELESPSPEIRNLNDLLSRAGLC